MCLFDYRDDSAKHATSPSRRDCARQVVIPRMFQVQSATPGIQNRPVVTPRTSARLSNPPACSALSALLGWPVRISLVRSERDTNVPPEKFRHKATVLIL